MRAELMDCEYFGFSAPGKADFSGGARFQRIMRTIMELTNRTIPFT